MAGGSPNVVQTNYKIGDNDNADPDLCSFDALSTPRANVAKETPFMVRLQVKNTGTGNMGTGSLGELYYNDENVIGGAVQVGTVLDGDVQVDSVDGLPTDGDAVDDKTIIDDLSDAPDSLFWLDGKYDDVDAQVGKFTLAIDNFRDLQYCIQFTSLAQNNTTYYFWLIKNYLDVVDNVAQVQTAPVVPKGVFNHPLNGPFGGPL